MSKLTDFIKLITGRFDNKEQFDKMQAEGKTYPYAKHINTALMSLLAFCPFRTVVQHRNTSFSLLRIVTFFYITFS